MGLLVLAVVGIASRADAGIITVPPGLAPGSQYRLAFVTYDGFTAVSSIISDYNTEVSTEANAVAALAALSTTWFDIGSTESVNAITNIGIAPGVPIYGMLGNLIAYDAGQQAGGLFSGGLLYPLDVDQLGGSHDTAVVWTGTATFGTTYANHALGDTFPRCGAPVYTNQWWVGAGNNCGSNYGLTLNPLYGISGVLTVPDSSVPEPATTGMVLAGGALMFRARRRIHRSRRPL